MSLSESELEDCREIIEEYLPDDCKVYREVSGDDNDDQAASDGAGGFLNTYNGATLGKKLVATYKCRETVPRGSSSINEEDNYGEINAYLRALITFPHDAIILSSDKLEVIDHETQEKRMYEAKEPLPHSDSISLRVIVVRLIEVNNE